MKHPLIVLLLALGGAPAIAVPTPEAPAGAPETAEETRTLLTPAQLDELLSPIALYPDPLIAIILPASTFPADLVLAARYLAAGGKADEIEAQPWDDSVKALARYPEVLNWMDQNLDWTRRLGAAFALQPADLLTSTQRLRTAARAAGNLDTTPQQTVLVEHETIRIVPARPEVIFVPVYDPVWVYRPRVVNAYHPGAFVRFGFGYRAGSWLSYHCDWPQKTLIVIHREHRLAAWHRHPRWVCPPPSAGYAHHVWRPSPADVRTLVRDPGDRPPQRAPRPALRADAPVAPTAPNPAAPATARPGGLAESARRAPAPGTERVASLPARGGREQVQEIGRGRFAAPPPAQTVVKPQSPPSVAAPPQPPPSARRIQSLTTPSDGGAVPRFGSRPSSPADSRGLTIPARDARPRISSPPPQVSVRQIPAPQRAERPSSPRPGAVVRQNAPSRAQGLAPATPTTGLGESEPATSRRGR